MASSGAGVYSRTWHEVFGSRDDPPQTAREVAFLERLLPLPEFRRVLDVCCGFGRHAARLAADGYEVTGIELDPEVAAEARRRAPAARIVVQDARELELGAPADAAIVMWASFGWFGGDGDGRLLGRLAAALRRGGRLVLDVYHPAFFHRRGGAYARELDGRTIVETKSIRGDRLLVELDYGRGVEDRFEWRLYGVEELEALAAAAGFGLLEACSGFDATAPPSGDVARMQLLFER